MTGILENLRDRAEQVEAMATDALAALGPWLAPIPSAALVARASEEHLHWSAGLGRLVAGAIIEILGLTATSTALALWDYNETRRKYPKGLTDQEKRKYRGKVDPPAPFKLAAALVGFYYVSTIALTVFLDISPNLARFAPVIFPTLALVGTVNLALRAQHKRRVGTIESVKAERKANRQDRRQSARQETSTGATGKSSNNGKSNANLDILQAGRKSKRNARLEALLTFYSDNPDAGPSDAARAVGVSRQTIYVYNAELEKEGKLRKNGRGWEVVR